MTAIEIFTLVLVILFVAVVVGYNYSKHKGSLKDMIQDVKDIGVQAEQVANELYNKDLRPTPPKKAPKKDKVTQQVEAMKKVVEAHDTLVEEINKITPEVVEKVVEIAKVLPQAATVSVEAVVEKVKQTKPEFPIDKPKRKRKYYPKKPKTTI